jgi:polyhydroxyalkanoate synthase subunit PhaC
MLSAAITNEFTGFTIADGLRRFCGEALDLWLARSETPSELVLDQPGVRLRYYGEDGNHPRLLIVPAPIKKPYIWDLTPEVSVVSRCLQASFRVYGLEWSHAPKDREAGIVFYADGLIRECVETVGEPVILAGHSLGGTFATIFASLHPESVRALLLLEAPLSFADDTGAIAALIRIVPSTNTLRQASFYPGTLLNALSLTASPESFLWWRYRDRLASAWDPVALRTHLLVERWTLDEYAMPSDLFADVIELYRKNSFMRGTLDVAGKMAAARNVTAPVLAVVDPESDVVPPSSVVPFLDVLPHHDWTLLNYEGDTGVALRHVGVLVGRNAHRLLWPEILDWIRSSAR